MPRTPKPTPSLDEQIAQLNRKRDVESLEGAKAIAGLLNSGKVKTLAADMQAVLESMPNDTNVAQIARNICSVLNMASRMLETEIPRITALTENSATSALPPGPSSATPES